MADRPFNLALGLLDSDALRVARFTGTERTSRPFRFTVTFTADPGAVGSPDELLGAPARLDVRSTPGEARRVQGVVSRIALVSLDTRTGLGWYEATLVPRFALTKRRRNSRVFQDQSVPEIGALLFGEHGVRFELRLHRTYAPRTYCVQYQESDFDFVTRLLAEEGIFYWFEDPTVGNGIEALECVVLGDTTEAYCPIEGETTLRYRGDTGLNAAGSTLMRFGSASGLASDAAEVRAFDFLRPELALRQRATGRTSGGRARGVPLEVYDYRHDIEQADLPPERATTVLEALRANKDRCFGESLDGRLAPGRTFEVVDHPVAALSKHFVVERVKHRGEVPEVGAGRASTACERPVYENRFECLPATVPARPKPPKRRVQQVLETATVVGPPGEEIHTDEHGRIKVQFHWDREGLRDDRSSCWIRVAQSWAGSGWGSQFIPRVGMEVIVGFSGGDTDRPVVLACLYNRTHPYPFPLPADKTKSGIRTATSPGATGSNELRFEDAAGAEQIYVHAQRDYAEVVERDLIRTVRGDEVVTIGGTRETTIHEDHVRYVRGNEVVTIDKNLVMHVAGSQHVRIDGGPDGAVHVANALRALEDAATATPLPVAVPEPPAEREGLEAIFAYRVARTACTHVHHCDALESTVATLMAAVTSCRAEFAGVRLLGDRLTKTESDAFGLRMNLPAVFKILERGRGLIMHLAEFERNAQSALAAIGSRAANCEALVPATRAASALVQDGIREASTLRAEVVDLVARLLSHHGMDAFTSSVVDSWLADGTSQVRNSTTTDSLHYEAGTERGGGPVKPPATLWKVESQEFSGPPDASGVRHPDVHPTGLRLEISPSGVIAADLGLRMKAGQGAIELTPDGVIINGPQITIVGSNIDIIGGSINLKGLGAVDIHGTPIKLNS